MSDKMVDYIAESLRDSLKQFVGMSPSSVTIGEALTSALGREVTVLPDDAPGAYRASMAVTPYELAQMAALRYSDGASHEDVTTWLETATGGQHRRVLCEVVNETGDRRWILRPAMLTRFIARVVLAGTIPEDQGAQNTAVDGAPLAGTGPHCTGVAGDASTPSDTDPV